MSVPSQPTSSESKSVSPFDFEIEFYKAHRAHELVLNNATAAYEQSALRLVLVINAAAIPVFLNLIQSTGKGLDYDLVRARVAIYWWAAGAACAFVATVFGYLSQRGFTQAHRFRRQAIEVSRVQNIQVLLTLFGVDGTKENFAAKADKSRETARRQQNGVYAFGILAVLCSVIGFANANNSINLGKRSTAAGYGMWSESPPRGAAS